MLTLRQVWTVTAALSLILVIAWWQAESAHAATGKEIDVSVDVALENFQKEVSGGKEFLNSSKGVLCLPKVVKAGVGFGGEYGEGALRIHGTTVDYYNIAAASFGFQFGGQIKTVILRIYGDFANQYELTILTSDELVPVLQAFIRYEEAGDRYVLSELPKLGERRFILSAPAPRR